MKRSRKPSPKWEARCQVTSRPHLALKLTKSLSNLLPLQSLFTIYATKWSQKLKSLRPQWTLITLNTQTNWKILKINSSNQPISPLLSVTFSKRRLSKVRLTMLKNFNLTNVITLTDCSLSIMTSIASSKATCNLNKILSIKCFTLYFSKIIILKWHLRSAPCGRESHMVLLSSNFLILNLDGNHSAE